MARRLSVYRREDVVPVPPDGWQVQDGAEPLYDEPLGSESAIRESWSTPAAQLGLPLLAKIYEQGFYQGIRWSGEQLSTVTAELDRLESHWLASEPSAEILSDLQERALFVREAVAIAAECGGWVVIT